MPIKPNIILSKDVQIIPHTISESVEEIVSECSDYLYIPNAKDFQLYAMPFEATDYSIFSDVIRVRESDANKIYIPVLLQSDLNSPRYESSGRSLNSRGESVVILCHNHLFGLPICGDFLLSKEFYKKAKKDDNKISLGSAPVKIVNPKLNKTLNDEYANKNIGKLTNNLYFNQYVFDEDDYILSEELEYMGKKYAMIREALLSSESWPNANNKVPSGNFSDATYLKKIDPLDRRYANLWFEVKPIMWDIISEEKTDDPDFPYKVRLMTDKAYFSGISFTANLLTNNKGIQKSIYETHESLLWQNCHVRALLNGYNLGKEIQINGSPESYSPIYDCNFENYGIINSIFKDNIGREIPPTSLKDNIISNIKNKRNAYGVTIDEKPMSIDEQLRFYIDNHMTVMLHGKSGIGKSKRVRNIDPELTTIMLRDGMMPEEIIGRECPMPDGGTKWFAPSWYYEFVNKCNENPDTPHILFIDEYNNADEHTQSLVFDLIHNRSIKS